MKQWRLLVIATALVAVLIGGYFAFGKGDGRGDQVSIRYGITPFQDSALPVVAHNQGWYERDGLDVKFVDLGWTDVPLALASGSVDVAIYNFDSFMSSYEQLLKSNQELVFYAPLYTWNGAAIMVRGKDGIAPIGELQGLSEEQKVERVRAAMGQLRGRRIGITEGTTFEQTVRDALRIAGMDPRRDVQLINARPEDNLAAFIAGDLDAFSAGLTERVQARRNGGVELLTGPDVSVPVVDGLVARRSFVEAHPEAMQKLVSIWFETVQFMKVDVSGRSSAVRDYLRGKASVDYTADEYAIAWTFQYFPSSRQEARESFLNPSSRYYWRPIWKSNSDYLLGQNKITAPIPESAFKGETTLN